MYSGWISSGPGAFPAFRVLRALVMSAGVNAWQSWSSTEGVCHCSRSRSCTFLVKALSCFLHFPLFTNAVATSDARGALVCLVDDFFSTCEPVDCGPGLSARMCDVDALHSLLPSLSSGLIKVIN